jgi:predicted ATPase
LKNGKNQALTDLLKDRINRYSEPIQDELELSERYDILRKQNSEFNYLANELESQFLKGRVHASEAGDLRFTPDDSKKELEIHTTSSTVKSLSPLVFYLRHIAIKNDFIIIDEPELNLHPDNQRKIARFMGRLVQEGFKILVSTHSDYIVRELNNLIMLHAGTKQKPEIAQDLLQTHGYNPNELLDKDQIGVYLFRLGQPVAAVPMQDTGFNVATIDEEAHKLNQTSQDIYFNLFD